MLLLPQASDLPSFAQPMAHTPLPAPANRFRTVPLSASQTNVSCWLPPLVTIREPSADTSTEATLLLWWVNGTRTAPVLESMIPANELPPATAISRSPAMN